MPLRSVLLLPPLLAAMSLPLPARAQAPPSTRLVLDRAGALVARYLDELPRLVARESMTQHAAPTGDGTGAVAGPGRQWVAEMAWVALPGEAEALAVRDVVEVDGVAVRGAGSRLVRLLHGPGPGDWATARAILDEGARHNLAPGSRNFNLPTVALFFLHPERRARFSWTRRSPARDAVWELDFRERQRPTIVRGVRGEQVYSRGRVWIEADSGVVRRTRLHLTLDPVVYTLDTTFDHVPEVGLVLPTRLDERYAAPDRVVVSTATYGAYRRFQTGARLMR